MISRFFIDRPIFAAVISIAITLSGLLALKALPVAQYPNILPPSISVSAFYPGASAEIAASGVATPLEQAVTGVDKVTYTSSGSGNGSTSVSVNFEIGTDVDKAAADIQSRINSVLGQLPQAVQQAGVSVGKTSSQMMMVIALQAKGGRYDDLFVSNYASLTVVDELKRIPGAGRVEAMGAKDYALRLWLRLDRMTQLGITHDDIIRAVREENSQVAVGQLGARPLDQPVQLMLPITTRGRLSDPSEFGEITIRGGADQAKVRLKDIARIELGSGSYSLDGYLNGEPTTLIAIYQSPTANALDLSTEVRATMDQLAKRFPAGISYSIPFDSTVFVRISIEEVVHTFFEALVLVMIVVFLFLQSWRATLIPLLAVPVSVMGTFAGMYLLGYSVNTLTLFGMVLAIGIVVDDAIVVIENVERLMAERRVDAKEAARLAMDEVTVPIIAIVLVLVSVFVPVAFMAGITGQLYKQFAMTIAVSVTLSGVVALTLTPALAGVLLKPQHTQVPAFFRMFNRFFDSLTVRYARVAGWFSRRAILGVAVYIALGAATFGLFKVMPSTFVPYEDQGYLVAAAGLPDGASFDRTERVHKQLEPLLREHPAVRDVISFVGMNSLGGGTNGVTYYVILKDWAERKTQDLSAFGLMASLNAKVQVIRDALVFVFPTPPIPGLGSSNGGLEFVLVSRVEDPGGAFKSVIDEFIEKARKRPELNGVSSTFETPTLQLFLDVDREKAKSLGVMPSMLFATLQSIFGSAYVDDFSKSGRTYRVLMQAESEYRSRPDDISKIHVKSMGGKMVPLSSIASIRFSSGPASVTHFNGLRSASVSAWPGAGYSSGQAMKALEDLAIESLPQGYGYQWGGQSLEEKKSSGSSALVFAAGLAMIFLILAAQYERWSLPLIVVLSVPFGILGAFAAIALRGVMSDVYFQIGLLTLVALSAKNAILIVEYAVIERAKGAQPLEAALTAAKVRFRPILMTSLAFVFGVVPLMLASGAGASGRHSLGTGVFGGMIASTLLAILFVPLLFAKIEAFAVGRKTVSTRSGKGGGP